MNAIFESTPLGLLKEVILVDDASSPPMSPGAELPHFTRVGEYSEQAYEA